jgi:hypothetical protein
VYPLPLKISAISGTAVGVHAFSWKSRILPVLGVVEGAAILRAQVRRVDLPDAVLSCPVEETGL